MALVLKSLNSTSKLTLTDDANVITIDIPDEVLHNIDSNRSIDLSADPRINIADEADATGIYVRSNSGTKQAISGWNNSGVGVYGVSSKSPVSDAHLASGVLGYSSTNGVGVTGYVHPSFTGYAVYAKAENVNAWGFFTLANCFFEGSAYPFTGAHFGYSNDQFEEGDIVVDTGSITKTSISNCRGLVTKSSTSKEPGVVGIYSCSRDKDTDDEDYAKYTESKVGFNALGEGCMNVCGEGGNISVGDYICSSSIAGKGMKQDDDLLHNYTVAKARENVTFTSPTEVKQIAVTYHCG